MEKIISGLISGVLPSDLEHYTTLVIQGLDLGFIVPLSIISGVLLIKRKPLGYLLSSVIIIKCFTIGAAITAMIINQYLAGVITSVFKIILFSILCLFVSYCLILILKNINEDETNLEGKNTI